MRAPVGPLARMLARGWRRPSAEGNYRGGHAADFVPESMAQKRLQRTRRQYFPAHQHNEPEPPRCHRPFMTSADTVNRSVSTVSIVRQRTCHRRSYGPGRSKLSSFSLSPGQPTQLTVLTVVFEGNLPRRGLQFLNLQGEFCKMHREPVPFPA